MFFMKKKLRILSFVLAIVMILLSAILCGCQSINENMDGTSFPISQNDGSMAETEDIYRGRGDFSIQSIDGKSYLIFGEEGSEYYNRYGQEQCITWYGFGFSDVADMKEYLNNMSDDGLAHMLYYFDRDENGIEIIDPDRIYDLSTPDGMIKSQGSVMWYQTYYCYGPICFKNETQGDTSLYFKYGTESYYEKVRNDLVEDIGVSDFDSIIPIRVIEDNKFKLVVYDKTNDEDSFHSYIVFCYQDGETYIIDLTDSDGVLPPDEWFLSFGLTPYIQK